MSNFRRRILKHTNTELRDVDYWRKLKPEEKAYLTQFMCEYYQADFNFEQPIHDVKAHKKECQDRNNAAKRQLHSVGLDLLEKSAVRARNKNYQGKGDSSRYYIPEDYMNGFPNVDDFDDVSEEAFYEEKDDE